LIGNGYCGENDTDEKLFGEMFILPLDREGRGVG
jgi:hypothetical protein